jgi:hypothetical protein
MAPSRKRKRKPPPKRSCPCCSAVLSEKTIQRHLGGTYLPTHIKVTRAAATPHKRHHSEKRAVSTSSFDLSGDISSDSSNLSSAQVESDPRNVNGSEPELEHLEEIIPEADAGTQARSAAGSDDLELEEIIEQTWSGRRARVDDYESDTESDTDSEDFNEEGANSSDSSTGSESSDEDLDSESPEIGTRNGLGMDDLVDEDFQRLISEFSV